MSNKNYVYSEYIHPVRDYLKITQKNEFWFEWGLSIFISIILYKIAYNEISAESLKNISSLIVNCLAILIGFSVTCLTILASASEKNITDLKTNITDRHLNNKAISMYRLLIVNFIFLLLLELLNLLLNFIFITLVELPSFSQYTAPAYSVITVLTITIFLLNVRNITNFYFVLSR